MFIDIEKGYDRVPRQEVWRCLREQGVPEKNLRLMKDTYEDAQTPVKTSIGLTGKITVRVGLHQGSSLSPYLFDMILDVMGRGIKEQHWCMLFADDIVLSSNRRDHVERKLEEWRTAMEERGLKISRRKTEYLGCNEHQVRGRDSKESEDIHIPGIDVGGGWRTGCGSDPPSAERMEELEESVCMVCCATGE